MFVASFIKFEPSAKAKERMMLLMEQIARENDAVTVECGTRKIELDLR